MTPGFLRKRLSPIPRRLPAPPRSVGNPRDGQIPRVRRIMTGARPVFPRNCCAATIALIPSRRQRRPVPRATSSDPAGQLLAARPIPGPRSTTSAGVPSCPPILAAAMLNGRRRPRGNGRRHPLNVSRRDKIGVRPLWHATLRIPCPAGKQRPAPPSRRPRTCLGAGLSSTAAQCSRPIAVYRAAVCHRRQCMLHP